MNVRSAIVPAGCLIAGIAIGILISPAEKGEPDDKATPSKRYTLRSAVPTSTDQAPEELLPPTNRPSLKGLAFDDEKLLDLATRASSTTSRMLDFERATLHLSAQELLALAKKAEELPVEYQTMKWARTNLLVRLARLDPEEALNAAQKIKERSSRNETISGVIAGISKEDIGLAINKLEALGDEKLFTQASNALLESGADGAARAIFDLLGASNDSLSGYKFIALGSALTPENLAEGLQLFERITSTRSKRSFLCGAVSSLAKSEPQAALDLVEAFGHKYENRGSLLRKIGSSWLAADKDGARAWISSLEDPSDRASALRDIVSASGEDREWIAAQIATLPANESSTQSLISGLTYEWGVRDPEDAVRWINDLPPGQSRTSLGVKSGNYARNWVANDPEAATAWLESREPTDPLRYNMLEAMAGELAKTDDETAHHWATQIPDEEGRHHALEPPPSSAPPAP